MKRIRSLLPLLALCLTGPTLFFGCQTALPPAAPGPSMAALAPIPAPPPMLPVRFADGAALLEALRADPSRQAPAGLWLSADDYRALEINVARLRAYQADLQSLIELYRKGERPDG